MKTEKSIEIKIRKVEVDIIKRIISKGGLFGSAAKQYLNDENKTGLFIKECSEQCHVPSAKELWGEDLVTDILKYSGKNTKRNCLNSRFRTNKIVPIKPFNKKVYIYEPNSPLS